MLADWRQAFGSRSLRDHAARYASSVGDLTMPADGVAANVEAIARVSGGVWIADCPTDGCAGAELVNFDELLFFCCECRNQQWKHMPVRVTVPDAETRIRIAALLSARPAPGIRHWFPDETIADLAAENKEHGI